ncbi:TonB-dependent copper receptor [Citrobacter koseri]|uniref:TonB-dependent copper receptor n=1 Tax=Citrobacter koseri TaxID=545 RepID=A0A2X2X3U3_CITKO|nr:TonB-dependent copper receptor [Citrobacter koseri]
MRAYRLNKSVKLSAGVDNLFDKAYSEHLNLAGNSSFGYSANTSVNEPGKNILGKSERDVLIAFRRT